MKQGLLLLFVFSGAMVVGQTTQCGTLIIKSKRLFHPAIYQSDSSVTFFIDERIVGKLTLSDDGLPETVNFEFVFRFKEGRAPEMQDMLTLHFEDSKAEFLVRSKQLYSGKIVFAIVR